MYQEKRPTCVTVIGWVWVILGGIAGLSSLAAFSGWMAMKGNIQAPSGAPIAAQLFITLFPWMIVVQGGAAVIGFVSGIYFLKLRAWARNVLEILAWLALLFLTGFLALWCSSFFPMSSDAIHLKVATIEIVIALIIVGIYAIPLIIILKYLRGDKVKNAVAQASAAITESAPA